ncbi:MAG: GTP cyclohydrolase I FolE, partial [bacterium]|nr:GTP cyclohydrolase I FolE [bacterium]
KETPKRFAKSLEKLFGGYKKDTSKLLTTFDGENYDEMIICKDIDFYSNCEHHIQPFFGQISIGYIPDKKIIGISKLPRIVEIFSRRLQNQERLTMQIADALSDLLNPKGVGVIVKAHHLCMMARGVEKQNATMTTSSYRGLFKNNAKTRNEFLRLTE